jgi:CDP-Glycerol:Poly(glycerophosphate) glycerophosphotransferase
MASNRSVESLAPKDGVTSLDIVALLPMLYGVRNVVYSGLLEGLVDSGLRVGLLIREIPDIGREEFREFRNAASIEKLLVGAERRPWGSAFINALVACGFAKLHEIESYELYRDWFRAGESGLRLRARIVETLGGLAAGRIRLRALQKLSEVRYRRSVDLSPFRKHLERLSPRWVWSTSCHSRLEYPYVLAARDLGIPVVASILSFDNLTSRPALPVFDHYLVWSPRMKSELCRLYGEVPEGRVIVTGTPQFDFHRRGEYRWGAEKTRKALGLPSGARWILYAASHVSLAPEEPALVRSLIDRLRERVALSDLWLVLRLHPQDDGSRWAGLADSGRHTIVSPACDAMPDADGWKLPTPEEQARLISSLLYAAACVNIVSTMSLDAALLDRPVIGVDFREEPSAPAGVMYSEYEATHYAPLVKTGAIAVARSWQDLLDRIEEAVADPERRQEERALMARDICGFVDGASTARTGAAIEALLGRRAGHGQRMRESKRFATGSAKLSTRSVSPADCGFVGQPRA